MKVVHKDPPLLADFPTIGFSTYEDGTQQWWSDTYHKDVYIERVVEKDGPHRDWHIVDRLNVNCRASANWMYPPIVAGPFPNLLSALYAYEIILSSRRKI